MRDSNISFPGLFFCSAFAACLAELCTIPLDTAKVRLQLQRRPSQTDTADPPKYKGSLATVVAIAREEGFPTLWNGIAAGLHRQCIYGGLRISIYSPLLKLINGTDSVGPVPLLHSIIAALLTGAIAIIVANPTDLVKVRLQAEGKLPAGVPRRYSSAFNAYVTIARQEGVSALWTGLLSNIARNSSINAAELASYDKVKDILVTASGWEDNAVIHIIAGLAAGFFAVCVGSPMDVVKSRMMGGFSHESTFDCFFKTLTNEGISAFYQGFLPNFIRLGTWNVIMFFTLERVKTLFV